MTFLGKRKTKEFAGSLRNQQVRLYNFGELLIENYLFLLFSLVTNYRIQLGLEMIQRIHHTTCLSLFVRKLLDYLTILYVPKCPDTTYTWTRACTRPFQANVSSRGSRGYENGRTSNATDYAYTPLYAPCSCVYLDT